MTGLRVDGVDVALPRRPRRDERSSSPRRTNNSQKNNAGAGGKRARGAARGGGQEYWRKLYRDVDYGDQHDVARFHEIYGNVTRDEATFTEAAAAENLRGGPMPMH